MNGKWILAVLAVGLMGRGDSFFLSAEELNADHVAVSFSGIGKDYAKAIAQTVSRARNVAAEQFAFDMPETIQVEITVDPEGQVNLFTDGEDHIFLNIRSEEDLCKPATTGIYQLYGMCHEVGHMAMYRLIHDHSWLKGEGAEGWAHYLGSRLVDAVHAKEGANLWPDRYDYLEDGTKRLEKQLSSKKPDATTKAAGAWKQLADIVGDQNIAPIFRAWGKADVDPSDPEKELSKALLAGSSDQIQPWWNEAQDLLIRKRPKSRFAAETAPPGEKSSSPAQELARDDGKSAGQRSMAGTGHAVHFEAPGDSFYLTEVRLYGSRYGTPAPPAENFHVWLCDKDFKVISDNPLPYSKFSRGNPRWVSLKVKPVKLPEEFIICVGFNPTATKGVYVHYDGEGSGHSLVGLPGEPGEDFSEGDWMIRVKVEKRTRESP